MDKKNQKSEAFQSISEEHYKTLIFGWKINEGLRNGVSSKRLKAYADWFQETYLAPHFEIEKKFVFPILGLKNVRVKKALANHRRLMRLFDDTQNIYKSLNRIEEEIGRYIRFEERILYKEIQEQASAEQLKEIVELEKDIDFSHDKWHDPFWEE